MCKQYKSPHFQISQEIYIWFPKYSKLFVLPFSWGGGSWWYKPGFHFLPFTPEWLNPPFLQAWLLVVFCTCQSTILFSLFCFHVFLLIRKFLCSQITNILLTLQIHPFHKWPNHLWLSYLDHHDLCGVQFITNVNTISLHSARTFLLNEIKRWSSSIFMTQVLVNISYKLLHVVYLWVYACFTVSYWTQNGPLCCSFWMLIISHKSERNIFHKNMIFF